MGIEDKLLILIYSMEPQVGEGELVFVQNIHRTITANFAKNIVGQASLVESLIICLLAEGHLLVEGVPGLAKTKAVKTLAKSVQGSFKRLQFTPDLLPADITGTQIYNQSEGKFTTQLGPIFSNIIVGDEINRAPAKVQSALLESMQERQISIAGETHKLPRPFMVMATQNPIEHEGTYVLPEAQLDRFMFKHVLMHPSLPEEIKILDELELGDEIRIDGSVQLEDLLKAQNIARHVFVDAKIKEYIAKIVFGLRQPKDLGLHDLQRAISFGPSPRGSIALMFGARIHALLQGRAYATPDDVKAIAHRCLRHRIILTYEAEAEAITPDFIVDKILQTVVAP